MTTTATWRAPRTPEEDVLCTLMAEVLGLERVGLDDNFFELGGHSLIAIQIIARLRKKIGVEVELPAIFKAPMVGRLAETILETLLANTNQEELQWLDQLSDEEAKQLVLENEVSS